MCRVHEVDTVSIHAASGEAVSSMKLQRKALYLCLSYADTTKVCQYSRGHRRTVEKSTLHAATLQRIRSQKTRCACSGTGKCESSDSHVSLHIEAIKLQVCGHNFKCIGWVRVFQVVKLFIHHDLVTHAMIPYPVLTITRLSCIVCIQYSPKLAEIRGILFSNNSLHLFIHFARMIMARTSHAGCSLFSRWTRERQR
jgi:hypothetical protein